MSYDLEVWSIEKPRREYLPLKFEWTDSASGWSRSTPKWQLVVDHPDEVETEDIGGQVGSFLPGIQYLTRLALEGAYDQKALNFAVSVARGIARQSSGVTIDPQTGIVETPRGSTRFEPFKRTERFAVLKLSWWFMDGPLLTATGRREFIDLLGRDLPEALPHRYGRYEPPQHRFEEMGLDHFLAFLTDNLIKGVVWTTKRPVVGVSFDFPKRPGGSPRGFRSHRFAIELEHDLLQQPGWELHLERFWIAASQFVQPFYGDVRVLRGYIGNRGAFLSDRDTEEHPVRSWWWRGIPPKLPCAVVLGSQYKKLWPAFTAIADRRADLAFVTSADWRSGRDVGSLIGSVPTEVSSKPFIWPPAYVTTGAPINTPDSYPQSWPFATPFCS